MDLTQKVALMEKYDRNLARLYCIAFDELAGSFTGPQLIRMLLKRGEKSVLDGGWVPKTRKGILAMVKRSQDIERKVSREAAQAH